MLTAKLNDSMYSRYSKEYTDSLELGKEYEVEYVSMGQSRTSIHLKGFDSRFNSIFFDFYEDGKEINIYESSKYNPYL